MVKLYAISVFYKATNEAKILKSHYDLQSFSFFQRSSVQEFIQFASKTIVERTSPSTRQSVKQDVYMCHVYVRSDNLAAVLIADHEYPGNCSIHLEFHQIFDSCHSSSRACGTHSLDKDHGRFCRKSVKQRLASWLRAVYQFYATSGLPRQVSGSSRGRSIDKDAGRSGRD
jgi:hypothetical protein